MDLFGSLFSSLSDFDSFPVSVGVGKGFLVGGCAHTCNKIPQEHPPIKNTVQTIQIVRIKCSCPQF